MIELWGEKPTFPQVMGWRPPMVLPRVMFIDFERTFDPDCYQHWFCTQKRRHLGPHRFGNYEWIGSLPVRPTQGDT